MNLSCLIIWAILTAISLFLVGLGYLRDWMKSDCQFIVKKWIDIVIYFLTYFSFIYYTYGFGYVNEINNKRVYICLLYSAFSLFILITNLWQIGFFSKNKNLNYKLFPIILVSLIVGVVTSFATLNYALYLINHSWFSFFNDTNAFETAFDFIYYAFSVTVTLSSNSILPLSVIPKAVQMIYVGLFYFYFANTIIVLTQSKKPKA